MVDPSGSRWPTVARQQQKRIEGTGRWRMPKPPGSAVGAALRKARGAGPCFLFPLLKRSCRVSVRCGEVLQDAALGNRLLWGCSCGQLLVSVVPALRRGVEPAPGGSVTSREAQAAAQSSSGAGAAEAGGLDEPELRQTEGARVLPGGRVRRSRSDLRRQRAGAARSWSGRWPRLPWGVDPSGSRWPTVARQQQKRIEGTGRWRMPKPPGSAVGAALRKARGACPCFLFPLLKRSCRVSVRCGEVLQDAALGNRLLWGCSCGQLLVSVVPALRRGVEPAPGGSVTSREAQAAAQSSSGAGAAEAGGLDEPELRQTEGARVLPGGRVRRSRSDLRRQRAGAARSWSGRWPRLPWGVDPSGSRWPTVARQQQKRIEGTGRWRMPKPPGSAVGAALRKARGACPCFLFPLLKRSCRVSVRCGEVLQDAALGNRLLWGCSCGQLLVSVVPALRRGVEPAPGGSVTSREAQAAAQSSSGAGAAEAGGLDEPELRQTEGARVLPGGRVRRSRSDLRRQRAGAARSWSGRWPRLPWGVDPSGSRWPTVARQQQKRIEGTGRWRMPKPPGSAVGAALRKARGACPCFLFPLLKRSCRVSVRCGEVLQDAALGNRLLWGCSCGQLLVSVVPALRRGVEPAPYVAWIRPAVGGPRLLGNSRSGLKGPAAGGCRSLPGQRWEQLCVKRGAREAGRAVPTAQQVPVPVFSSRF
ncbi:uncharacterized protein LOC135577368 [Columba livia]|uniref:uncharacterized protein LOC135577368 n=1 Tax=Columba livia TaxID=8932 RepID=UPI0031BAD8B4